MRYLSLCSGIEAATVAWEPLGWRAAGYADIEPFTNAVLAHHYPNVLNLGDLSTITDEQVAALGPIDLVIGGTPCQDLSVAGKRAGLAGERSGLFHDFVRIFDAARRLCGARWCLWENVPGAFSSHSGRDFAVVVGSLVGSRFDVPRDGWRTAGAALGPAGFVEWRVLDAQFFGLAQRRKRVFALLDSGDWRSRAPVLLEPESLRRDSPPRRETRERPAGTLAARSGGGGGFGTDFNLDGGLVALAHGQGGAEISTDLVPTLTCVHEAPIVAHALTTRHGNTEDGTGRGAPIAFGAQMSTPQTDTDLFQTLQAKNPMAVTFDLAQITSAANRSRVEPGSPASTMTKDSSLHVVQAFAQNQLGEVRTGDVVNTLNTNTSASGRNMPMIEQSMQVRRLTPRECERLQGFPDDYTLIPWRRKLAPDGPRYSALGNSMAVPVIRWIGKRIDAVAS